MYFITTNTNKHTVALLPAFHSSTVVTWASSVRTSLDETHGTLALLALARNDVSLITWRLHSEVCMWRGGNHHGGSRHRLVGLNTNRLAVLGLVAGDGGDGGVLEDFQLRHDVGEELVLRGTGSWCEARHVHVTGEERAQNTEATK